MPQRFDLVQAADNDSSAIQVMALGRLSRADQGVLILKLR